MLDYFAKNLIKLINNHKKAVIIINNKIFMSQINNFLKIISYSEKHRIQKFHSQELQNNYIISHAVLRIFLSKINNIKISHLEINTNSFGKPFLSKKNNNLDLRFNISHSGPWTAYAFSLGREIGVDIEENNNSKPIIKLAELVFSDQELESFSKLSAQEQQQIFFRVWTAKEALSKNFGQGLHIDFKTIHLGLNPTSYKHIFFYNLSKNNYYYACLAL